MGGGAGALDRHVVVTPPLPPLVRQTALNDLAVTAAVLRAEGLVRKVLVVDLDVHQGDGTAEIFRDEKEVVTMSMHCR